VVTEYLTCIAFRKYMNSIGCIELRGSLIHLRKECVLPDGRSTGAYAAVLGLKHRVGNTLYIATNVCSFAN
jgi:hypothetical protein